MKTRDIIVLATLAVEHDELTTLEIYHRCRILSRWRFFALAFVYTSTERLEDLSLISARYGEDRPPERRGRPRRFYRITEKGEAALKTKAGEKLLVKING